jgi:uncharacterized protein
MEKVESVAGTLRAMVRLMVDRPDETTVEIVVDGPDVMYRVHVSSLDLGKMIGKGGRTARSLRQILQAVAMTQKIKISLDISGC